VTLQPSQGRGSIGGLMPLAAIRDMDSRMPLR
jgi:hypothetical protein